MRADDQVVALWGIPDWQGWAAREEHELSVPSAVSDYVVALERTLLVDAELSPLRIGRQPQATDRRPLDSF